LKLVLLIALTLAHLAGPGLAEAPGVTDMQKLEQRVKDLSKELNRYKAWWASADKKKIRIKPSDF